jgi:hypothetical protein
MFLRSQETPHRNPMTQHHPNFVEFLSSEELLIVVRTGCASEIDESTMEEDFYWKF